MNILNEAHATRHPSTGAGVPLTAHKIATSRRQQDDGPMTVAQVANARREVEYLARRNGLKAPLLQIWKVRS